MAFFFLITQQGEMYTMQKTKPRYQWIDIARGIAMMMVVFGHFMLATHAFDLVHHFIYLGSLPVFFFFSGMLFHLKTIKVRLKTVFNTLVVPYLVFALAIVVTEILHRVLIGDHWGFKNLILGILWAGGDDANKPGDVVSLGAVWFFIGLGVATLLFELIAQISRRLSEKWQTPIMIVMSALLFAISFYVPAIAPWSLRGALVGQFFMLFGYLFRNQMKAKWSLAAVWLILVVSVAVWWVIAHAGNVIYLDVGDLQGNAFLVMIGALASVLALSALGRLLEMPLFDKFGKMISWVGEYSSIVLSVHAYILLILESYVYGPTINNWVSAYGVWVAALLTVLISIGSAIIGALVIYKASVVQRVYMDRNWPLKI